ncbi:spore germination protein [Falsibacillus pallidus]|uniref:GerA spore germination protein n=1 Tax=Falsibacillus pallidus TaxID=493781 RepID=A0A370GJ05_9BACI|nr:spore germination protein [Falsibacillus pallidus]RDI43206.1 GerA spore germination protein [Falsibacillus pallidus]
MFKESFKKAEKNRKKAHRLTKEEFKADIQSALSNSSDLLFRDIFHHEKTILLVYLENSIKEDALSEDIIKPLNLLYNEALSVKNIYQSLNIGKLLLTNQLEEISQGIINGYLYIFIEGEDCGILADIGKKESRGLEKAETESLVYGPKISFTESIATNVNIVRNYLSDEKLAVEEIMVGNRLKRKVSLVYISDVADEENVSTFRQRITDLDIDSIIDASVLAQLIEDNSITLFPQLMSTELPDRFCMSLLYGKVGVLVDRSPISLIGPTSFYSFFETTEDVYVRWNIGTFLRILRFISILLSILLTPAYVAVLTYHYEVIPSALLTSLGESRSNVPFPPVFEALLLEFIIELLREAGARLPTKVGQTMGIVGGIVIGQAAVQAGFTSNILIIIIAISALGSFTTPSYLMGSTLRILRFPIIFAAGLYGGIGIMFAFCLILIHLLRQTSMGRPYLTPLFPLRLNDLKYSLIRAPISFYRNRPESNMPKDHIRFFKSDGRKKNDLDE